MSTHVGDLLKLRALSVQKRRQLIRDLANPETRDSAQDLRDLFHKVQTTIETVDRTWWTSKQRLHSPGHEMSTQLNG